MRLVLQVRDEDLHQYLPKNTPYVPVLYRRVLLQAGARRRQQKRQHPPLPPSQGVDEAVQVLHHGDHLKFVLHHRRLAPRVGAHLGEQLLHAAVRVHKRVQLLQLPPATSEKQQKICKKSKKLTTARSLATVILPWTAIKRA